MRPGPFGALRRQLLEAAAAFAGGSGTLAGILSGMVDDVDRALGEELEIFPVCHHSPASALAMVRRLRDKRPKVIARLPFIERPGHPAGTPVFVVSKPLADAAVRDVVLYAASFERWGGKEQSAVAALGCEVIASAGSSRGLSVLLAAPGSVPAGDLQTALAVADLAEIGSHAERFAVGARA